jgi:hypothetical protein
MFHNWIHKEEINVVRTTVTKCFEDCPSCCYDFALKVLEKLKRVGKISVERG